jgi:hypothetical protein
LACVTSSTATGSLLIDAGNLVALIDGLSRKDFWQEPSTQRIGVRAQLSKTPKLIGKLEARMLAGFPNRSGILS